MAGSVWSMGCRARDIARWRGHMIGRRGAGRRRPRDGSVLGALFASLVRSFDPQLLEQRASERVCLVVADPLSGQGRGGPVEERDGGRVPWSGGR